MNPESAIKKLTEIFSGQFTDYPKDELKAEKHLFELLKQEREHNEN